MLFKGPWHCEECVARFCREGVRDLTLDTDLHAFLALGILPDSPEAAIRVMRMEN